MVKNLNNKNVESIGWRALVSKKWINRLVLVWYIDTCGINNVLYAINQIRVLQNEACSSN